MFSFGTKKQRLIIQKESDAAHDDEPTVHIDEALIHTMKDDVEGKKVSALQGVAKDDTPPIVKKKAAVQYDGGGFFHKKKESGIPSAPVADEPSPSPFLESRSKGSESPKRVLPEKKAAPIPAPAPIPPVPENIPVVLSHTPPPVAKKSAGIYDGMPQFQSQEKNGLISAKKEEEKRKKDLSKNEGNGWFFNKRSQKKQAITYRSNTWRPAIFAAGISAALAIILVGGYYYWATRIRIVERVEIPSVTGEPAVKNEPVTPSILVVSVSDRDDFLEKLRVKADEAGAFSVGSLEEVRLVDRENNPITTKEALALLEIFSNEDIAGALMSEERSVSLFLYRDALGVRLGVALPLRSPDEAIVAMRDMEGAILAQILPLYEGVSGTLSGEKEGVYAESIYKNTPIRYMNFLDVELYSIDYGIVGNRLVVGTSKDTFRAIVDNEEKKGEFVVDEKMQAAP